MKFPSINQATFLMVLLGVLLLSSVWSNRESLLFCEQTLFGETKMLEREKTVSKPISFSEVCPDLRARSEANLNKWLEVLLALMVQFHHPTQ
jgi:hypothetical protein